MTSQLFKNICLITIILLLIGALRGWYYAIDFNADNIMIFPNEMIDNSMDTIITKTNNNINNDTNTIINLVILVPLRNRDRHLTMFTNYITDYIEEYDKNIHLSGIIAIEQIDNESFSRSVLLNIGAIYVLNNTNNLYNNVTYIALHDVDWIPLKPTSYYPVSPNVHFQHIMPIGVWYPGYVGGVSIISLYGYFKCINGFSNQFFGWGGEDDDLFVRMKYDDKYLNGCKLNHTNFLNLTSKYPVYADYIHLNKTTQQKLPEKYHNRVKSRDDHKWNAHRLKMTKCDHYGYLQKNDGVNNLTSNDKYIVENIEKYGKLTIVQVKLFRDDNWHSIINKYFNKNNKNCTSQDKINKTIFAKQKKAIMQNQ